MILDELLVFMFPYEVSSWVYLAKVVFITSAIVGLLFCLGLRNRGVQLAFKICDRYLLNALYLANAMLILFFLAFMCDWLGVAVTYLLTGILMPYSQLCLFAYHIIFLEVIIAGALLLGTLVPRMIHSKLLNNEKLMLQLAYERFGTLARWSKTTTKLNNHLGFSTRAYANLKGLLLDISRSDRIIFLSPTANSGEYEKTIIDSYGMDSKRRIFCLASDLSEVNHVTDYSLNNVEFRYKSNVDVLEVKEKVLAPAGLEKVDVIWDIKGFLWYGCKGLNAKKKRDVEGFDKLLSTYEELLQPGGLLVIDAVAADFEPRKGIIKRILRVPMKILNHTLFRLVGTIFMHLESSTYGHAKALFPKSKYATCFEIIKLMDGPCSLVVFKKR